MKAEWSHQARDDLRDIFAHIAAEDPAAARRLLKKSRDVEERVLLFPMLGRVVPELEVANVRERVVPPYRVVYQLLPDAVLFLTVVHGRSRLAALGPAGGAARERRSS